jgi:hypothetical protein
MLHSNTLEQDLLGRGSRFRVDRGCGTITGMEPPSGPDVQVLLAEYAGLRAEIERRTNLQWSVFALQLASAGAVASVAITTVGNLALLLIIPVSSYMLGSRYILHDFYIKLIRRYLRDEHGLRDALRWESWRRREVNAAPGQWLGVKGLLHPTRMAFEGVGILALLATLAAALYLWSTHVPGWPVVAGWAAGWVLGTAATAELHRRFVGASGE